MRILMLGIALLALSTFAFAADTTATVTVDVGAYLSIDAGGTQEVAATDINYDAATHKFTATKNVVFQCYSNQAFSVQWSAAKATSTGIESFVGSAGNINGVPIPVGVSTPAITSAGTGDGGKTLTCPVTAVGNLNAAPAETILGTVSVTLTAG